MNLFTQHPKLLLAQLEANESNLGKGMRWDELVLRIEWNCEVEQLLQRKDLNAADRKEIQEAARTNMYCFNTSTVDKWLKEKMFPDQTLASYIETDFQTFYWDRYHRLDELLESMVEKKKDANGNVTLGEGFDKNCGLKGSKLSGG